jgi:hypothetical protein
MTLRNLTLEERRLFTLRAVELLEISHMSPAVKRLLEAYKQDLVDLERIDQELQKEGHHDNETSH